MEFIKRHFPASGTLGNQAALIVVGDSISFVSLFATAMVLARVISVNDMATYRQTTYIGPFVVGLVELGISASVYRYITFYAGNDRRIFLCKALIALTGLGVLGSLTLAALAFPLARSFHNADLGEALLITCTYPLMAMPWMMVRPVMISQGHSIKATLWETAFGLGTSFALIVPLWRGSTIFQGLVSWMAVQAIRLPVTWQLVRNELSGIRPSWKTEMAREVWGYLWPIQLSRLPALAMVNFDKLVTSVFLSKQAFAAFSLGAREIPFLNQIPFSISSVLVPRMVEYFKAGQVDRVCELWRKAALSTAVVTFPFAAFCVWYALPIVRILFTSAYDESAIPFRIYAGITFLRVLDYGSLAKALGNSQIIMRCAFLSVITGLPLMLGMTWFWGVWGISCCLLLSLVIVVTYYTASYKVILQRPIHSFFPVLSLVGLMVLAFAAIALADLSFANWLGLQIQTQAFPLVLRLAFLLGSALVFYVGALIALRQFKPQYFTGLQIPGLKLLSKH